MDVLIGLVIIILVLIFGIKLLFAIARALIGTTRRRRGFPSLNTGRAR